jgi:P27 family predicted phage terminase small subunit
MRGRKPKPTALKKLAGNPGRRPLNDAEPQFPVGGFSCPKHLSDYAKGKWREIVPALKKTGMLASVDQAALEAYCEAYATYRMATDEVKKEGITIIGPKGGTMRNPACSVANQAMTIMNKFGSEFGLTPSTRSRLKVVPQENGKTLAEVLFDGVEVDGDNE